MNRVKSLFNFLFNQKLVAALVLVAIALPTTAYLASQPQTSRSQAKSSTESKKIKKKKKASVKKEASTSASKKTQPLDTKKKSAKTGTGSANPLLQ